MHVNIQIYLYSRLSINFTCNTGIINYRYGVGKGGKEGMGEGRRIKIKEPPGHGLIFDVM